MKVLIKKFSLLRDGVTYGAGQVLDLPEAEALKLAQNAPKEFALLEEAAPANIGSSALLEDNEVGVAKTGIVLETMTVEQLKNYALENGIDLGRLKNK